MKVAFFHPDLGLGGAERLIVDAAVSLQRRGHSVTIFTSRHDPNRCFDETRNGELRVVVVGGWLPRAIFHRFAAFCATIRSIFVVFYVCLWIRYFNSGNESERRSQRLGGEAEAAQPCVAIVDQVAAPLLFLRYLAPSNVRRIFYAHYPDLLLVQRRVGCYRWFMDAVERRTTAEADVILFNSRFTYKTYEKTMPETLKLIKEMHVLYPAIDVESYEAKATATTRLQHLADSEDDDNDNDNNGNDARRRLFVSLNRFERKKNISLAINAFARARKLAADAATTSSSSSASTLFNAHLIIAGGYDSAVTENVDYYNELQTLAMNNGLKLNRDVTFIRSYSLDERQWLLQHATAVLYTPPAEHFGIVPLEAQAAGAVVVAVASGGPLETIENEVTGFLLSNDEEEWAATLLRLARASPASLSRVRRAAVANVRRRFSLASFGEQLERYCSSQ